VKAAISDVLAGGGAMGALMRARDWSATPIGPPEEWPQSLRTAVGLLLDSRYPMYIAWGHEFTQLYNDAYRPILGSKKHPAALGQSTRECFAEIWDFIGPMFERVMEGGDATFLEDQILPMDRHNYIEECYFTFCYSAIRGEAGTVGGVFVTCTETTSRVLGERRLRVLRDLGAAAAGATTEVEAVAAALAVLETDPADIPFSLLLRTEDAEGCWPVASVLQSGRPLHLTTLPSGIEVPAGPWPEPPTEALILPVIVHERVVAALVCGISGRRRLDADYRDFLELIAGHIANAIANAQAHEEERRRANALAELDRAKTAFFNNVSHEFRTPLTLMLGPLEELLSDAALEGEQREAVATAHRNALRQLRLVNTLLDFSRIEAGRIEANYRAVDLRTLTADLASAFRSAVERAGLSLIVDLEPVSEIVFVDPAMWEKIVLNLLSNAFKHTFEGSITVALRTVAGGVELRVIDTGVGIAEGDQKRIFDRFHRVKGARARSHEGTGIGLSLVRELVHLHSGHIDVHSEVGAGTTFSVFVPFGTAHLPHERIDASSAAVATVTAATPFVEEALRWLPGDDAHTPGGDQFTMLAAPHSSAGAARVLIADDNLDLRDYLNRLLTPHYDVQSVPDGAAALAAARASLPDLVVADVMMPGLDGFELLQALRADPATRDIPVVLLSARAGEEARVEGLAAGADDYIAKPFGARELVARVAARLELSRVRKHAASEREQLIRELSREREQLAEIFELAPAFIAVLRGADHVFERVNERYIELTGGRPLVGRAVREVFPELAGQGYFELLDQVYHTGHPFVGRENRMALQQPGSDEMVDFYFNFVYQPLRNADGTINGVFVHGLDVTELVAARRAAEQADQTKSDFMATMSHELRTPLNAIIGYVELLRLGVPDTLAPRTLEKVDRIGSSARHLLQLIEEVLSFTQLQAGGIMVDVARTPLQEIVDEIRAVIDPLAAHKGLEFDVHVDDGLHSVDTDARKLRQVLLNLLGNAMKFTERGHVRLDIRRVDAGIEFRVQDTGIGMAAQQLERIFEPFWQADQTRTRTWGGTGLGLAISQRLVALIGGELSATSEVGVGSCFTLRLPAAVAQRVAV
jgi:signal transduction histidine kinase/FixJ family two-component response regulator